MRTQKTTTVRWLVPAGLALAMLAPAAVSASSTATLTIRGYVPLICRANFESAPAAGPHGVEQLGRIHEFCNSATGYRVIADYDGGRDTGYLLVDGRRVDLDGGGSVVIAESRGPAATTRSLGYVPGGRPIGHLHIRVQSA
ncbi:MAG TPA: hypothetical protein VFE13_00895 [Caulobacteraceae bacterium]|jgi:hypothetical protein|nr:hypothetical protein [Caulobacteraceae bacterium]